MQTFPETELILTADKRLYHLHVKNEDIADDVILVGDPARVEQISKYFSKIEFKANHREFITHTGFYNAKRITVISTGIGTDNIDIVLNELDAAVNINLVTRQLNPVLRRLNIIRLGTSGALHADMPVNTLIASSHGVGLDGLLPFYHNWQSINEQAISDEFIKHCQWPTNLPYPYCVAADVDILQRLGDGLMQGITATAPGFYGPQGRQIRLKAALPQLNDLLASFAFETNRITNFEMETSALYGLGKLLGHRCLTMCVIIANRATKTFTANYNESVERLIQHCLNKLTS
ncbi:MAG: nucleoside phosphorylase [Bacteroidota bacterium]